jgi:SAM-dependent methyltransferase
MFHDVVQLQDFYEDRLGRVVRRTVRRELRQFWPDVTGQRVLGLGYATPYLNAFAEQAERTLAFMPAQQGVLHWPGRTGNAATLIDEGALPLPDYSVDRVLLVHSLEHTEQLRPLLSEVWRVMMGDARLLVVVPNRRSLWARLERTPLAHGRPFSHGQLNRLLRELSFIPREVRHALFVPPTRSRTLLGAAPAWERVGKRWLPKLSGLVMLEATKQVYAMTGPVETVRVHRPVIAPVPAAAQAGGLRRQEIADAPLDRAV